MMMKEKSINTYCKNRGKIMSYVVKIDDRGRILLPLEVRRKLKLKKGSRLILRVTEKGYLEAFPMEEELKSIAEIFRRKFAGWKEEDHEASILLLKMRKGGGS